jgi:hypothetical protein
MLHASDDRCKPGWDRVSFPQLPLLVIVAETERGDPSLAFKCAELNGCNGSSEMRETSSFSVASEINSGS